MASHDNIIGWILRGTKEPMKLQGIASHQVLKIVHDFSCRIAGVLELYIPETGLPDDDGVHDMIEVLKVTGVIVGEPFFENADRVHDKVKATKPRLFRQDPPFFRIFRVREERLRRLIERLDDR